MIHLIIPWFFWVLYIIWWLYLWLYHSRITRKEKEIKQIFISRTDSITGLFEVSKPYIERHAEVFSEILSLRKKEFVLMELSDNIKAIYEVESKIHHELNFIFQVCNTHPKILKDKKFLYIREVIIEKSSNLWLSISQYNKHLTVYNKAIEYKKYTIIWMFLPFHKKELLQ